MVRIKIKRLSLKANIPQKMSEQAAGADIYACLDDLLIIPTGKIVLVPCGFAMSMPKGYEAQIRPRSGLAAKYGVGVLNSPGTIDADYRGEVKVIMINFGEKDFQIKNGDRIAQMVIAKLPQVNFEDVDQLDVTARASGGFGHTDI